MTSGIAILLAALAAGTAALPVSPDVHPAEVLVKDRSPGTAWHLPCRIDLVGALLPGARRVCSARCRL